jgi:hypothetical protein
VRQGSILGPVLFLVLISHMANALGIGSDENVVYVDDTTIWQAGKTVAEVVNKLKGKAARFAEWSRGSGLTMNGSKTQLLPTANAGSYQLGEPGTRPCNGDGRPGNGGGRPGNRGGQPGKGGGRLGKGEDQVTVMVDGKEVKAGGHKLPSSLFSPSGFKVKRPMRGSENGGNYLAGGGARRRKEERTKERKKERS